MEKEKVKEEEILKLFANNYKDLTPGSEFIAKFVNDGLQWRSGYVMNLTEKGYPHIVWMNNRQTAVMNDELFKLYSVIIIPASKRTPIFTLKTMLDTLKKFWVDSGISDQIGGFPEETFLKYLEPEYNTDGTEKSKAEVDQ